MQQLISIPTPVSASATATSGVVNPQGMSRGAIGLQSDHAGTLQVQRYVDSQGTVPLGAVLTVPVVAATPIAVGWSDGLPCGSLIVSFINSAGAVANLTNIAANLAP